MIWAQGAVCFLAWVGYGIWLRGRSDRLRDRLAALPRPTKVVLGSLGILGSAVVLFAGLWALSAVGGVEKDRLALWAWPVVIFLGLFFVHMQVLGAAAMILLVQQEVTERPRAASVNQEDSASNPANTSE